MRIKPIPTDNAILIRNCKEIANQYAIENSILLGDLHLPCIKLTEIFGLFDKEKLKSFFVKFNGFPNPSIVIPYSTDNQELDYIMIFLQKTMKQNFGFVTYDIHEKQLNKYFEVSSFTSEFCMVIEKNNKPPKIESPFLYKASIKNLQNIDTFYKTIQAYPWNPIQLESGFYFYIEINKQIVACGGTHFETDISAQLGNIFVLEEHRGKQFGKQITIAITREILERKEFATLFVFEDNIPALSLYKKLGFRIYKPVNIYFCEKY
jgi:ribosomal protein S18 acetylase RimI-like enzyme